MAGLVPVAVEGVIKVYFKKKGGWEKAMKHSSYIPARPERERCPVTTNDEIPPEERDNCDKCHRAPRSHGYSEFRTMILETHPLIKSEDVEVDLRQCWRCHVTHDWRHLRML